MASKNNDSFNFDIPLGIIIAAWFVMPPIGIVLTVLRVISEIYKANKSTSSPFSAKKAREEFAEAVEKSKKKSSASKKSTKKKKSAQNRPIAADVLSAVGWITLAGAAITAIVSIPQFFTSAWFTESLPKILLFAVSSVALLIGGNGLKKRTERLSRIKLLIGGRDSFNLSKLAAVSGTNIRQTRRDVQKLIDKGEFGNEAYIDLATNNFMRTPDAIPDTATYEYKKQYGNIFSKKKGAKEDDLGMKTDNDDFRSIIREIRRLNDEIEDEAVSQRIDRIEEHTKNIFDYVSEHPEKMPQIRTFMSYYLPTTLKLLESYSRIEKVGVAGENMKKSKENIESTLDALEVAFRMQIDDLFRAESIDISSDISVLETMMSKDGLTEKRDFDLGGSAAQGE